MLNLHLFGDIPRKFSSGNTSCWFVHSTRDDYKTPRHALCNAFTGGFFCQLLNTLTPEENDDKTASILSILGGNVFTMEGRLVGLLLNSDAEVIKKQYEEMRNIAAHDCRQFLTYQNIASAPYDELCYFGSL